MNTQNNQWQIVLQYQRACELASKHGFAIKQDEYGKVKITAHKEPYVIGTTIAWLRDFYGAVACLEGSSQHILEVKNT